MANTITVKRGTRAQVDTAAGANGLNAGEPYLVTDEGRPAVGLGTGTYVDLAKKSEVDDKAPTENPSFTGSITEEVHALSGTTPALDPANGTRQTHALSGNTTYTESLADGQSMILTITNPTGYTCTFPTTTWVNNGGSAPTLSTSAPTVIALWQDSTTLMGALVGDGS